VTLPDYNLQAEDLKVVQRCIQEPHGEEAWLAFLVRFGHVIETSIRGVARTATNEDREDMFQAVLFRLAALNGLAGYDPTRSPFRAYLRAVVQNAVRDVYREAPRETFVPETELSLAAEAGQVACQFPLMSEDKMVDAILKHLNARVAAVPKLRIFRDIVHETPVEVVMRRHRISRATAYRYRMECLHLAYEALGKSKSA
jgi:DNA-directed RNA polymerase specialized sigma24 family protein